MITTESQRTQRTPLSALCDSVVIGLVLLLVAIPIAAQESVKLPPPLDRVLRDYERAWQAKDAAALAALFTEDGFVLSNGKLPVRGREQIRLACANSGGPLSLRAFEYKTEKNTGYIIGGFATEAGKPDSGKFVLAIRRVKGKWLIAADMDNGNRRPPGP